MIEEHPETRWGRLSARGLVSGLLATLLALSLALLTEDLGPSSGVAIFMLAVTVAASLGASLGAARTAGFITFSLTHLFAALSYRFPQRSFFSRETFNNRNLTLLFSLTAIYLPTELDFMQRSMGLVSVGFQGWLVCLGLASITLWVSEIYKWLAKPQ